MAQLSTIAEQTISTVVGDLTTALPRVFAGLIFLSLAWVSIRLVKRYVRRAFRELYPEDQRLVADLATLVVTVFLWFGAGLALLKVIGMGDIAASLGSAAGFIALGVSYALSSMIADAVAGVYLLKDPDFNPGDRVVTDSTAGEVREIGLRKSRIEVESGDTVVLANRDVEKKWTKRHETVDTV